MSPPACSASAIRSALSTRKASGAASRALISCGHRPAETVALHGMHAGRAQEQLLVGGLHAFRRHLHAEAAAEADHRVHDGCGVGGLFDAQHEAAVDLELVERQAAQIEQARIAGAEIVERQPHADCFQPQHAGSAVSTLPSSTLSVSSISSRVGSNSVSLRCAATFEEIGAAKLQRRHVDRDGEARPGPAVEAGAPQHPGAEIDDQS